MPSPLVLMEAWRLPRIESYFRRWASVFASVISFTATKSTSRLPMAARMMFRPIRPKPLIPTLTPIGSLPRKVLTLNEEFVHLESVSF